jgi:hypothetical protein
MQPKALAIAVTAALLAGSAASAFADDGQILRRQISSPPGETQDPEPEGEHAFVKLMNFHVPSQAANGELVPIEYYNIDDVLVKTEEKAKPLISVYVYGPVIGFDDFSQSGFPGHGKREAYGAVSLDDGETWQVTNLSNSADNSSFTLTTDFLVPDAADPACHHTAPAEEPVAALVADAPMLVQDDDDDDDDGPGGGGGQGNTADPEIEEAEWDAEDGELDIEGETGRRGRVEVTIVNAATGAEVCTTRAETDGEFECEVEIETDEEVPCSVVAVVGNAESEAVDVEDAPENCDDGTGGGEECTLLTDYPGDVTNIFHAVAGNKVLAAWQSKFCSSGFPGYTGGAVSDPDALATYLGISNDADLYLTDLFDVAGSQASVDYREQEEFDGEYDGVGEVPYNCLWTARGVLRENPEVPGTSELVWFQAERLTSGRRDVNRIETACVAGGGCAVTWQEDPEGLRPGEGEGAGTGWAGATTNSQTDIWYSFIEWEDFDIVDPTTSGLSEPLPLADNILDTGRPQPYVPMMVPARLTNNARCQTTAADGYCNSDVDLAYGLVDQCVGTIEIPLGPQGNLQPICVVDANKSGTLDAGDLPNVANTAASRPRLGVQPRDTDGDGITDDAWVVIIHEEDKGLGRFGFLNDETWDGDVDSLATVCTDPDANPDDNCVRADLGKNQWYISFAMGTPQTSVLDGTASADVDYSMLNSLVYQQNIYNAPEVNWITGTFYPPMSTEDMWNFESSEGASDLNFSIFNTEIARRASLMSQSLGKALTTSQDEALVAMPLFKEGIINQGGPADIMARRIAIPANGGGGEECPIDDNVDADQPVVESATLRVISTGGWRLQVTVSGFDGIEWDPETRTGTRLQLRNAVTTDLYGFPRDVDESGTTVTYNINADTWTEIPCAIQVADWDVPTPAFGPWTVVDTSVLPDLQCTGPIPPACE